MKVIRILTYEGTDRWVLDTLSKSIPDGIFEPTPGNKMVSTTFGIIDLHGIVGSNKHFPTVEVDDESSER